MHDVHEQTAEHSHTLFVIAGIVLLFGLVMLGSATAPIGAEKFGSAYYFLVRQLLFGLVPGVLLFFGLRQIPLAWWERSWKIMLAVSFVILALVFIPGIGLRINGSLSWIHVGPYSLQPAELVKFTFIIFLAGWLAHHRRRLTQNFFDGLLPYLVYLAIACGLMLLQPDLGTALVFFITAMIMAFVGGARVKHLSFIALAGIVAMVILISIAPYRMDRITALFDPDKDPYGSGYHIKQSLVAVGSGGVLGMGLGNSRQKFQYLPEVSADSIFAVIAEEMGFIISVVLVAAYVALGLKGYQLARRATSDWATYFIVGTVSWIGVQTVLNIGAMLALVPLTGLPLPLVSHGGTSLMVTLAAFGVISAIVSPPEQRKRSRL